MKLGVCTNLVQDYQEGTLEKRLAAIASVGYDYVETVVAAFRGCGEEVPGQLRAALEQHGIPCSHANILFPGDIKIVGEEADLEAITAYLKEVLPRAASIGVHTVVLGSGGARRIPEGFPRAQAEKQFAACARAAGDVAGENGMRIALEHLNPGETNFLTSVRECVEMLERIGHPGCGLLFDYYHAGPDAEELALVERMQERLYHVHLAMPGSRRYPVEADREELAPFFALLDRIGYGGSLSLEANLEEGQLFEDCIRRAYPLLRQ